MAMHYGEKMVEGLYRLDMKHLLDYRKRWLSLLRKSKLVLVIIILMQYLIGCGDINMNSNVTHCRELSPVELSKNLKEQEVFYQDNSLDMENKELVKVKIKNIPELINKERSWISVFSYEHNKTLYHSKLSSEIDFLIPKKILAIPDDRFSGGDNLSITIYNEDSLLSCTYSQPTGRILWKSNNEVIITLFSKRAFNNDINEYEMFDVELVQSDK